VKAYIAQEKGANVNETKVASTTKEKLGKFMCES
jgi:hypothetical protein